MRSRWNLPVYIVYAVICCAVISVIVGKLELTYPWSHPYRLAATFRTGDGILVNNEVFMNGTKVGKVADVAPVNGQARVDMVITEPSALPIFRDSAAEVRKKNLVGETYVEVSRGTPSAGAMQTGDEIPVQRTLQTVQIDQVLAILDPQTRDRLKLLINGAGDALTNRGGDMNAGAHSFNQVATSLNGPAAELNVRQQQLEDIILELQRFYDMLAKQRDQVRDEFATWNQVTAQLAAQEQQIGTTVQQADRFLSNLDAIVSGQAGNIQGTLNVLPSALKTTNTFLDETNDILGGLAPYRRSLHDVFPDLGTSFQDTTAEGQHIRAVYSCSDRNNRCTAP